MVSQSGQNQLGPIVGSRPLEGVKVLDLSRVLAGPWCTQTLADLGADVIKIEKPETGDDTRSWGPPYAKDAEGCDGPDAAYYMAANRGKKSVTIDIATEDGQALIRDLALKSDILVENFKVGGLARYGLDYQSLNALNPQLIYCSITGFGQTGPYATQAGYDYIIQGMSGLMSVTGEPDSLQGSQPMRTGVAVADIFTGLYATTAILAALRTRDLYGEGQHIDMALLDSQVAVMANQSMNYLTSGKAPGRIGNSHPNIVPYQVFATQDGHFILAVGNDHQFQKLCDVLGLSVLGEDARFVTNALRVKNREILVPILSDVFKSKTTSHWIGLLKAANIPHGPINDLEAVFDDPHVKARGLRQDLPHPSLGSVPTVRTPIVMSKSKIGSKTAPPELGEHTEDVLSDILRLK